MALSNDGGEYWACGTMVELWLLAPILGQPRSLEQAQDALDLLKQNALKAGDLYAMRSTHDQLRRYIDWWTRDNGFFGDRDDDLAADAAQLLAYSNNP